MAPARGIRRRCSVHTFLPHQPFFPALLLLVLCNLGSSTSEFPSEKLALLAFKSAVHPQLWDPSTLHCNWSGVRCNATGAVFELHLRNASLRGAIPLGIFGNLTNLRYLSLGYNNLTGPIPTDIAACTNLNVIDLDNNEFSGDIPATLGKLWNLKVLSLAGNLLSGEIPAGLSSLSKLTNLTLEQNRLVGQIPDLDLPNLREFNVSYNMLSGKIPQKLQRWPKTAFLGMDGLCGDPLPPCSAPPGAPSSSPSQPNNNNSKRPDPQPSKLSGAKLTGIIIACIIGFLLLVALVYVLLPRRHHANNQNTARGLPVEAGLKDVHVANQRGLPATTYKAVAMSPAAVTGTVEIGKPKTIVGGGGQSKKLVFFQWDEQKSTSFYLDELLRAPAEILGKGTFGTTFRAWIQSGLGVAVKRLKEVELSESEFQEALAVYGSMNHPNVMPLRAYYYSKEEKLLVYDYEPGGSLSALLHESKGSGISPINWDARMAIALDAARGLEYIHSTGPSISHGNIKSSNVLLSKSACISDHGLVWIAKPYALAAWSSGYRAPEMKASQKADVYSFGVLLLELLTGKAPTKVPVNGGAVNLPSWVRGIVPENWAQEVFDGELLGNRPDIKEEMFRLAQVALDCAAMSPDVRPTMTQVVRRIDEIRPTVDPAKVTDRSLQFDADESHPSSNHAHLPAVFL